MGIKARKQTTALGGAFVMASDASSTLAADTNNLDPGAATTVLRLTGGAAQYSITGIAGGVDGRVLQVINVGTANALLLVAESASSTAANRLSLPASYLHLNPNGGTATLIYDATSSRWRCTGAC